MFKRKTNELEGDLAYELLLRSFDIVRDMSSKQFDDFVEMMKHLRAADNGAQKIWGQKPGIGDFALHPNDGKVKEA